MKAVTNTFSIPVAASLRHILRLMYKQTVLRLYQATLRWVQVDQLPDVETVQLRPPEVVPLPEAAEVPFLVDTRRSDGAFVLPEARAAVLREILYSPYYQIAFLSKHRVLADTINDAYPFKVEPQLLYRRRVRPLSGYATSFRARWNNYYHTLIDVFPRLELLHMPYFRQFEEIKALCPGGLRPLERFLLDALELPPNVRVVEVDEEVLYQPEYYVHVSYATHLYCGYLPDEYRRRVRAALLPQRPSRRTHRILISRQKAYKRRIQNVDELTDALAPLGFISYPLETLSITEQIELFYDADVVVGAHGAGLTNVLFSDHVRVVELFPSWYVLPHYYYLCLSLGHPYRYCLAEELDDDRPFDVRAQAVLEDLSTYNDVHFRVDVNRVLDRLGELGIT